jgi:hypothetical protein
VLAKQVTGRKLLSRFMKLAVLHAVPLLLLMAGCASHKESNPAPALAVETPNPFTKPLTSIGGKFGRLPVAVQNTVRAEAGTAELVDVVTESTAERVYYKVLFRESAIYPPLLIAPDGSVLNPDLTVAIPATREATGGIGGATLAVTLNDLPANALKAIQEKASIAEITGINKEIWGTHVVYVVTFRDSVRNPRLFVVADGTVLTVAP